MAKLSVIQPLEDIGPLRVYRTVWDGTAGTAVEIVAAGDHPLMELIGVKFIATNGAAGGQTMTIEDGGGNDITDAIDVNLADEAVAREASIADDQAVVGVGESAQALPNAAVANTGILWTTWGLIQPA